MILFFDTNSKALSTVDEYIIFNINIYFYRKIERLPTNYNKFTIPKGTGRNIFQGGDLVLVPVNP